MDSIKQKRRLQTVIFAFALFLSLSLVPALLGMLPGGCGASLAEESGVQREEFSLTLREASLLPGSVPGSVRTSPETGEISLSLSPFTLPGQYAALEISVENTGLSPLSLAESDVRWDAPSPAFRLSLPDFSGESLSPGEQCQFSVILSFSPEGEDGNLPMQEAVLRLCYEGEGAAAPAGASPKTGDPGDFPRFAALSALFLVPLCFALASRLRKGNNGKREI